MATFRKLEKAWPISSIDHDQDAFSFYPDERCGHGFEEVLSCYRELVPNLKLADLVKHEAVEKVHLPKGDTWSIHKFGGTCIGTSERMQNVAKIIVKDESERKLVVVSAMLKVIDMMYDLIHKAQAWDDSYIIALNAVLEKHKSTTIDLPEGYDLTNFLARLHQEINNLKAMLHAIYIAGHVTESFSDFVLDMASYGLLNYSLL